MTRFKINNSILYAANYQQMVDKLSKKGTSIIQKAYETKGTKDRTYNQHDAYTYGVFYKGKLVKQGYLVGGQMSTRVHGGWPKHNYPSGTGKEYADDAMKALEGQIGRDGFALVVMNPIYYTKILENGAQSPAGVKYQIISQMYDEMEMFAKEIKGTVRQFNTIR